MTDHRLIEVLVFILKKKISYQFIKIYNDVVLKKSLIHELNIELD